MSISARTTSAVRKTVNNCAIAVSNEAKIKRKSPRGTCKLCGAENMRLYQRRRNGLLRTYSYCQPCASEIRSVAYLRWISENYQKKLAYTRAWKKANRDKVNAYARKSYKKKRNESLARYVVGFGSAKVNL